MSDQEFCCEAYRQMYRAMIVKDAEGLNTVPEDSFVLVHMTGMNGSLMSFMDRAFFAGPKHEDGNPFAFKSAAAVVSACRAGTGADVTDWLKQILLK